MDQKPDVPDADRPPAEGSLSEQTRRVLADLHMLPGSRVLDRILDHPNPEALVRSLPAEDFYWLIKKLGEEDCLPILEMGTRDQWQHLLDLEIWDKDLMDMQRSSAWLDRLNQAHPERLVKWLFSDGEAFAHHHLFRNLQVVVASSKDEVYDLSEGFFSFDGVLHVRVGDTEFRDSIENILRVMARMDYERYQALILGLAGVIPAELEEEMYRLRNVRLAEHGFLPYEEALSVYAPLDARSLQEEGQRSLPDLRYDDDLRAMVPVSPLFHAGTRNMLAQALPGIDDPLFLDRLRLEFAGLCNQLLAAEGFPVRDLDVLIETCRKAAGYIGIGLERMCDNSIPSPVEVLKNRSLLSLFRVGFGLALKLKWEAERWLKESWFGGRPLRPQFWGEAWGGILEGLVRKRPLLFVGLKEDREYREFERLSEIDECREVLRRVKALDDLLKGLASRYPLDPGMLRSPELTYRPLLFNLWARSLLEMEPSFRAIPLEKAKTLFQRLRGESTSPPYRMAEFKAGFVQGLLSHLSDADSESGMNLKETLSSTWEDFQEEYAWVSPDQLDPRYSRFLWFVHRGGGTN
ncbi:MAG: hypothetical protein JW821_11310 [Deltaproteobacteria bacterium]|nr:hypothetical protein [Deltaproteobacteria bacterium]